MNLTLLSLFFSGFIVLLGFYLGFHLSELGFVLFLHLSLKLSLLGLFRLCLGIDFGDLGCSLFLLLAALFFFRSGVSSVVLFGLLLHGELVSDRVLGLILYFRFSCSVLVAE